MARIASTDSCVLAIETPFEYHSIVPNLVCHGCERTSGAMHFPFKLGNDLGSVLRMQEHSQDTKRLPVLSTLLFQERPGGIWGTCLLPSL